MTMRVMATVRLAVLMASGALLLPAVGLGNRVEPRKDAKNTGSQPDAKAGAGERDTLLRRQWTGPTRGTTIWR